MDSDDIVGSADTPNGVLEITRINDRFTISVDGVVRHPDCNAESALGAMCHYLHGVSYALLKAQAVK